MGKHMKNGECYTGYGEQDSIRYVKDPSNPNFDWIQVQDEDGNWINYKKAYLERQWLVQDGLNRAGLELISSDSNRGTLTQTDDFLVLYSGGYNDAKVHNTLFRFSETLDFTNYDKVVFEQSTTFASNDQYYNKITVSVQDIYGNILATHSGTSATNPYTDDIVLDVSNIKEVGSVYISVGTYLYTTSGANGSTTCKLSNVYAT